MEIEIFIYLFFLSSFLQRMGRTLILGSYVKNAATARMTRPKWSSHTSTRKTGGMWLLMLATVSRNMGWSTAQLCGTAAPTVPAVAAVSRQWKGGGGKNTSNCVLRRLCGDLGVR